MSEIIETYQEEQERLGKISLPDMVYATVVSQDSNGLQLLFDGEDSESTKRYPYNLSGSYGEGQRVLTAKVNGKYVVLFPVGLHSGSIQLSSLSIQSPPNKTEYLDGEAFDPTGMLVRAHYSNGAAMPVRGYTYSPQTLTLETEEVTVQYTTGGITKTASVSVSVAGRAAGYLVTEHREAITFGGVRIRITS